MSGEYTDPMVSTVQAIAAALERPAEEVFRVFAGMPISPKPLWDCHVKESSEGFDVYLDMSGKQSTVLRNTDRETAYAVYEAFLNIHYLEQEAGKKKKKKPKK